MLQVLEQEQLQRLSSGKELPQFRAGDVLEVTAVRGGGVKGLAPLTVAVLATRYHAVAALLPVITTSSSTTVAVQQQQQQ